ncbi:hypothetical protein LJB42_000791 [Komagataella kurtzmanii]|nr:hypothetical protein LJB42_000791 [Komagataella kurtzmanii]
MSSPYAKFLVDAIRNHTDWELSIVVPSQQRSWIGKAHFAGKELTAQYLYSALNCPMDDSSHGPFASPVSRYREDKNLQEWVLIDGTPASCTDIGVHHLYKDKPPVDLVLSGPNYGRNSTALYIMASGTLGGALEGALTGKRAIGLSYSFYTRDHDAKVLKIASELSLKLIKYLYNNWHPEAELYSINVPLKDSLGPDTKAIFAPILENRWGSVFTKVIESKRDLPEVSDIVDETVAHKTTFKWTPDFDSVHTSVKESVGLNDGKVVEQGNISVTPLKAVYKGVDSIEGEIDFQTNGQTEDKSVLLVTYDNNSYIFDPLIKAMERKLPKVPVVSTFPEKYHKLVHYGDYEGLNFDKIVSEPSYKVCSYIYRKALIRKHYLANTVKVYKTKHPESILATHVPLSYQLELDYAEFLDDALDEYLDLREELEENESSGCHKTYILKPSMSDKAQGIRIFRTIDELQAIFDSFEDEASDAEEEAEETNDTASDNRIIISQLRHFIVQEYVDKPLLLPQYNSRKLHIRTYIVANGDLEVYVFEKMLLLFANDPYVSPEKTEKDEDGVFILNGHLTNTCAQKTVITDEITDANTNVVELWSSKLTENQKQKVFGQVKEIVKELFKAALSVDRINFQPLSNAFEVFGIDFLVNENFECSLLEVNSYPDFKQTGDGLKQIIYQLFEGIVDRCISSFYFPDSKKKNPLMHKVLDTNTGSLG